MKRIVLMAALLLSAAPATAVEVTDLYGIWNCTTNEPSSSTASRIEVFSDGTMAGLLTIINGKGETAITTDLDYQGTWRLDGDVLIETLTWLRVKSVSQNDAPVIGSLFAQIDEQFQGMVGLRTSSTILDIGPTYLDMRDRLYDTLSQCERI